ncbi:MAG: ATP-dependent RecD-like DNA helicase [Lactococcus lactis]|nr:ATP-dependent RecD-like DNA helicase [Lactococcus lactis]
MNFTPALINNIEKTYTYSFAHNVWWYTGSVDNYNPLEFFHFLLRTRNPFKVFMELDRFAYRNALNHIEKYEIPYTEEQQREAKIFSEVTETMKNNRTDYISMYVEDPDILKDTGVVLNKETNMISTVDTVYVAEEMRKMPKNKKNSNVLYENKIPKELKESQEQYEALETCLKNHISSLIGGAGTGKSFVTSAIVHQLQQNNKTTVVLAPTHKAKEALQEKLDSEHITGEVRTIHSFIHPPEYGSPFEKIQKTFPAYELKDNKRSEAADIISLGRQILGKPQNANMLKPNIEYVSSVREAFEKGAEVALTFTNDEVKKINEQERIKNGKPTIAPNISVGDVVMATVNNKKRGFYNGQIFEMINPKVAQKKGSDQRVVFTSTKDLISNFTLAYGLTINKAQGTEWDNVAYLQDRRDTRSLAYVAVTRAKKKLFIVGEDLKTDFPREQEWRHME